MDVRWNSTFLMLKHLIPYKSTFSVFINGQYQAVHGHPVLTSDDWYVAEKVNDFLELFYDSTVALSGVYYPTSPLIIHQLIEIAAHLKEYETDYLLRKVVVPMKDKYLKYWKDIPMLYSFAFVLDPRAKLRGLTKALALLSSLLDTDYTEYFNTVRVELTNVFAKYESKFGAVRLQRPPQPVSSARKKTAWGKIFGSDASDPVESTPLQSSSCFAQVSELSLYLDSDPISVSDDDLDILSWWHEHKQSYHVLSILAKDVLTVPVSTISSESTFSLTGRVLEERRRRLTSDMVEIITCLKDWHQGEERAQHTVELHHQALEVQFKNLYLDAEGGSGAGNAEGCSAGNA